jgi:cation/acetate symporter
VIYPTSGVAIGIFVLFVLGVLALSFYLGRKAKSASGYYAAHGEIHWFVNGFAFAGDYLSAASFLGICGLIAVYGYDGFLYSIGYLAGWIVALFVIAEPIKRLGKFTFADALDAKYQSTGIKLTAAISTLIVSIFYLIPQMVGAGALVKPLLGLPHWSGVVLVGIVVILIVVTAGMVSTTWVQFIKGSLLIIFCTILTGLILNRGLTTAAPEKGHAFQRNVPLASELNAPGAVRLGEPSPAGFIGVKQASGAVKFWHIEKRRGGGDASAPGMLVSETQMLTVKPNGDKLVNGLPQTPGNDLHLVGSIAALPGNATATGPLNPVQYLAAFQGSTIINWSKQAIHEVDGSSTTVYYQVPHQGAELLTPGGYFKGLRSGKLTDRLDFISLMLALFCGTASLPHILIRYYTVKDAASARKSTVVGIASIGFFYVLTLYLGLGAMTSGFMDPTDSNMAAPLLAKSFNNVLFAVISAIAFTTVLGTVSGLIMAASGAVAHDLMQNVAKMQMTDHQKVFWGKVVAVLVGVIAMWLGVQFKELNVSFLVGWAFNVAASANLPALVMLLFWQRTTRQGITWSIVVGLVSSLAWLLLSAPAYKDVYHLDPAGALAPFSQPGLVTIPLSFVVLVVVSLFTQPKKAPAQALTAVG